METDGTTGIILAGGKSSRMGEDKGLMMLDGIPMVQHVIHTLDSITGHLMIVANNKEYEQFDLPVYPDLAANRGPMGGIVTGLTHTRTAKNWIVSCDTPYVSQNLLLALMEMSGDSDVAIPVHMGRLHPLIGYYNKATLPLFREKMNLGQLKLSEALKEMSVKHFNADIYNTINFKNINSKADL